MADTRGRLVDGAMEALRDHGLAGASARTIAATAGVNQALVFYHFGSVDQLLAEACQVATERRLARYRDGFAGVDSLAGLLALGRTIHEEERALGNVGVLAQLLAGAQAEERYVEICRRSLALWSDEIEAVLRRVLAGSPLADLAEPAGLARGLAAAFIGLELYDGVDPGGAASVFAALDRLAVLIDVVDDLGPVARRALKARLRRADSRPAESRLQPPGEASGVVLERRGEHARPTGEGNGRGGRFGRGRGREGAAGGG